MNTREFILYSNEEHTLLHDIARLQQSMVDGVATQEGKTSYLKCVSQLLDFAYQYGFYGNLYHCYLTHAIVTDENPFSKSCEITSKETGNITQLAQCDFAIWKGYFSVDLYEVDAFFGTSYASVLLDFQENNVTTSGYPKIIVNRISQLAVGLGKASDLDQFQGHVVKFYQTYGVGNIGLHMAFRIQVNGGTVGLRPIEQVEEVRLDDLVGYAIPKQKLVDNTEAFLAGKKANNCLLFGDAGTGKSSSVKGILNEYYHSGLRMIELYRHEFQYLNDVIAMVRKRNYKFIIYMDDLSFEEFEVEYKYLKAVIEGGLEDKANNVLIYATSNRRHLIRESFRDKEEHNEDLHRNDTVQEKLSLAARFGVSIYFGSPDKKEFQEIVKALAERYHIHKPEEELLLEANQWELAHGGLSGRTAQQFMNHLVGRQV